jgi:hypothetical protein
MITGESIRGHVYFLASDALGGRYVGSSGYEVACQYGESQFKAAGLVPAIEQDAKSSYRQVIPVITREATSGLSLIVTSSTGEQIFMSDQDFKWCYGEILPWEERRLEVVFVGYGISEPDAGWDDLHDLDVKGKAVLIMMGAPTTDGEAVLPESVHMLYAPPSAIFRKMSTMMLKGAAAILALPDSILLGGWEELPSKLGSKQFEYDNKDTDALHIPFLGPIKPKVAEALFAGQYLVPPGMGHLGPETIRGFELEGVSLSFQGSFTASEISTWNIVGVVEGTDPVLRDQFVAVTAHLDTTAPQEEGEIYNGADDNASGSAGLIEIAKAVAADPPRRSVVFVLFSGEEGACLGSRHFVSDCPVPLDKIVADVNLDMIGRTDPASMADRSHYVLDSGKITPKFTQMIKEVNSRTIHWPLKFENPVGNSDNLMFQAVNIPAVLFYSGHHDDVNEVTDDPEKLDYEKAQKISQLVYELTIELGNVETPW